LIILAVFIILVNLGMPLRSGTDGLISLSSTAIVLRIIQKKEEFDSIYGRTTLGILIFQDIAVVPMMLVTPLLPGALQTTPQSPLLIIGKGVALIILVIVSAKWIVPRVSSRLQRLRLVVLLSIVGICCGLGRFWLGCLLV
jgi:CPA2 family monovalent cation:H+ antiporter-2